MASGECPSREKLLQYLQDVDDPQYREIRKHVTNCKSCADRCYMMDPQLDHTD